MLVLSRKKNEAVIVNNDVRVTVVEIRGEKVRLGFEYPKEVPVHREEGWEEIYNRKWEDLSHPSAKPFPIYPPLQS